MKSLQNRFESKIEKTDSCWNWLGSKTSSGYGLFYIGDKRYRAHRVSYTIYRDTISDGLVIDHLCKNKLCVNPEHLEQVTQSENVKRGLAGKINNYQKAKTACPRGHEYTRLAKNGSRVCGKCRSDQQMAYKKRKLDRKSLVL
jgi:hypothetical protein